MNAPLLPRKGLDLRAKEVIHDPVKFCQLAWPHLTLYDKQVDILDSLRYDRETFVHAGNKLGKDFIAGIAVVWFFCSRDPVRVVASSSGQHQLENVLWKEIATRLSDSQIDLGLDITHLRLRKREGHHKSYVIGVVTNKLENLQGYHLPQNNAEVPSTLYIADEASGIANEFHESAQSWAHRMLVIGNPMNNLNFFFTECKRGTIKSKNATVRNARKVIHIGAEHSPNVILGKKLEEAGVPGPYPSVIEGVITYEEFLDREQLWDPIKRQIRLHGHFYEGEEVRLYPPDWLSRAELAYKELVPEGYDNERARLENRTSYPRWMGLDVGAGGDLTAWTVIDREGVIWQHAMKTPNTVDITNRTVRYLADYNVQPMNCVIDAGGGGKQIADRLRELGHKVRTVYFGENPSPPASTSMAVVRLPTTRTSFAEKRQIYKNRRAEMYGYLRLLLDPSVNDEDGVAFAIPEELEELHHELSIMPLQYDEEGKMFLPPKDRKPGQKDNPELVTIKKILGRSPDRADSLVLAVFGMFVKARKVAGAL